MIPVLSASQIKGADAYTIENEPIRSIDLMERASKAFVTKFNELVDVGKPVYVFAGPGNNGGDGLAIARLLVGSGKKVEVFVVGDMEKASPDFKTNYKRLQDIITITQLRETRHIPQIACESVVIDGLFGSGLSRPVEGFYAEVFAAINSSGATVFAIDIPSGLFADSISARDAIIRATHTISFQTPKLTFLQPSSYPFVGDWYLADIGLNKAFIDSQEASFFLTESKDIVLPGRSKFSHKGSAGRVLLVSGSKGRTGATTLAARATMRAGAGLLFIHSPKCATDILQINVPEAMVIEDEHHEIITGFNDSIKYDAVGVGPGIGTNSLTKKALIQLLEMAESPMVLDADAINILAGDSNLVDLIPKESILTPHPGEFRRLVGEWKDDLIKLDLLRSFCRKNILNVVLKGAYSAVCNVDGVIHFNPTGNPGMATAGSGDVLTGIITAFLGQGLTPFDAMRSGVFVHGCAGDLAKEEKGEISLIASDIVEKIPSALRNVSFS